MLVTLDKALRTHRRRLVTLCAMAVLAASVLGAHSALASGDHMGMGIAVCVAVIDTAVAAATVALARRRPALRLSSLRLLGTVAVARPRRGPPARSRAGPAELQVFRL